MTAIRFDSYRTSASRTGLSYRTAGLGLLGALWLILGGLAVAGPADWPVVENTAAGSVAGESPAAVALDERGNSYIAGAVQTVEQGRSIQNVYITKLDPSGQNRVYTARLSGTGAVRVRAIAVDDQGNAYVAGCAGVSGIAPVGGALQAEAAGGNDAFVAKLDATGNTWLYATYLGGKGEDCAEGIAVDRQGNAYVTGWTSSSDFPVANALQKSKAGEMDAFIAKLNPNGSSLSFSTYAGGGIHTAGRGIALDNMDAVLVAGEVGGRGDNPGLVDYTPASSRAFILELAADGSERKYGALLGDAETSAATALAVSAGGEAFVTGWSGSPLARDVFVTRLGAIGQKIYYRLIGAWTGTAAPSIAVDAAGSAYVSGLLEDAGGQRNTKIVKLSPYDGSLLGSTVLTAANVSAGLAMAVGKSGTAVLAGTSEKGRAFAGKMKTCSFRLSEPLKQVGRGGETGSIGIETTQECGWSASSSASWLEVYPSGTGFGTLFYRVAPNSGGTRGAIISVAGHSVPIVQAGAGVTALDITGPIRSNQGFQANALAHCDDCFAASAPLGFTINFYGNSYATAWVNNNGNVTLDSSFPQVSIPQITGQAIVRTGHAIVAPFLADVDTTKSKGVATYGQDIVNGHAAFGVNWVNVGFFQQGTNPLNSFQLVLIDRPDTNSGGPILLLSKPSPKSLLEGPLLGTPDNFDIEMNYGSIQWDVTSGGPGAAAGFSLGTGSPGTYLELSGSETAGALLDGGGLYSLIAHSFNSNGVAGRYLYSVRAGIVTCASGIFPISASVPSTGGTVNVAVNSSVSNCAWNVTGFPSWISVSSPVGGNGIGNANVALQVAANTTTQPRTAPVLVAGSTITITEQANSCTFAVAPPSVSVFAGTSMGSVQVSTQPGCAWNPSSSDPSWLSITSPNQTGSGTLTYSILQANPNSSTRTGFLTIGGVNVPVNQVGSTCQVTGLHPASANLAASAGSFSFAFDLTPSDCAWTVAGNPSSPFITVNADSNIGSGTVNYSVSANTFPTQRNGTINLSVTGLPPVVFNITQLGTQGQVCTYLLSPTSQSFPSGPGQGSFAVTAPSLCAWTPTSNVSWLTPSGTGPGNGNVSYTVSLNPSTSSRSGVLNIGGQKYVVTQSGQGLSANCIASLPSGAPQVALEGETEVLGDLRLTCTGLTAPVTADIILTVNTNITNTSTVAAVLKNNTTQQTQAGDLLTFSTLHWPGVVLPTAGTVTISGVRVDASVLSAGTPIVGQLIVNTSVPLTVTNSSMTMANPVATLGVVAPKATSPASDNSGFTRTISFQELTQSTFQPGNAANPTRLHMVLSGIPAGVSIWVPTFPNEGQSRGQLWLGTDCSGQGGAQTQGDILVGGVLYTQLTVTAGVATATWQVVSTSLNSLDTLTFPVLARSSTDAWPSITLTGSYAPAANPQGSVACGTADPAASAFPRYRDFSVPVQFSFLQITPTITRDATGVLRLATSITNSGSTPWTGRVNSFVVGSNGGGGVINSTCAGGTSCTSPANGQVTWLVTVQPGQTITGLIASQTPSTATPQVNQLVGLALDSSSPTKQPPPSGPTVVVNPSSQPLVTASAVGSSGAMTITGAAGDALYDIDRNNYHLLVDNVDKGPFSAPGAADSSGFCIANAGIIECPNVGFTLPLDTLSPGAHTVSVVVRNINSDQGMSASIPVNIGSGAPSVFIDSPQPGAVASNVTLSGWAIDNQTLVGSPISTVQVKVDGNVVGNANYGGSRVDVCNVYPGRPNCPNVGYSLPLNLSAGSHTITVSAVNTDPTPQTGSATVVVTVPGSVTPPVVAIDSPAPGSTVSGTINVSGWAIDSSATGTAISLVQVKVDGNVVGNATYGGLRNDVCAAFPGRPGCPNVGYTFSLNTSNLAGGTHTLTVSATNSGTSPSTGSASLSFTVPGPTGLPPTVAIDTPAVGAALTGTVSVGGWAIDNATQVGTAISSVQVKVDGNVVGNATYGASRSDVCAAFPGRPGCPNVGYTFSLNTSGLSVGTHTLTVSATDTDAVPATGSATRTFSVTGAPPAVFIDSPQSGAQVSGVIGVAGWAIDSSAAGTAISSVQVKVDGNVVGNATYGASRADVCAAFPGRPGCPNVGYAFTLNTAGLSPGNHTLTVSATDSDASPDTGSASTTFTVSVSAAAPTVVIDGPASGTVLTGTAIVSGWAIDNATAVGTPIASVQVRIDGNVVGNATYGSSRGDVCAAFPGRPNCPNVGWAFALNTAGLTNGSHTLTVVATDTDATPATGSASVTIQIGPPPLVAIDSPAPGSVVTGIVNVSGWAIDNGTAIGTAIGSVQVKVDGNLVGTATYGTQRTDVCAAYPGRPGCPNVGYSFSLNASTLTSGTHTITVTATDTDVSPDSGSASVTVTK